MPVYGGGVEVYALSVREFVGYNATSKVQYVLDTTHLPSPSIRAGEGAAFPETVRAEIARVGSAFRWKLGGEDASLVAVVANPFALGKRICLNSLWRNDRHESEVDAVGNRPMLTHDLGKLPLVHDV